MIGFQQPTDLAGYRESVQLLWERTLNKQPELQRYFKQGHKLVSSWQLSGRHQPFVVSTEPQKNIGHRERVANIGAHQRNLSTPSSLRLGADL
jgi:hypothetical protein